LGILRLFAGLLGLVVGLAEIATATAHTVANGRNVTSVQVATGRFTMTGPQRWLERRDDGKTFNFVEVRRDKWSVYLLDSSRGVNLQIDLRNKQIFYSDTASPRRPLYPIVGATAAPSQAPLAQAAPPQAPLAPLVKAAPPQEPLAPLVKAAPPQEPLEPPEVQPPPAPQNTQEFDYQSFARSPEFANETLTAHNELRARHGAQPLRWSTELARTANDWALSMTSTRCEMEHSGGEVGENIAMGGYLGPGAGKDAVSRWYNEVGQYDYRNPGFSLQTGHYTQVVWASTTELGCAMVRCGNKEWNWSTQQWQKPSSFYGAMVVVCQYSPAGNFEGRFPENVSPPVR
jgi:glioma pathogenesis-related protein 2